MKKELARAILRCMEIREDSYDRVEADKSKASGEVWNWSVFYKKSIEQACQEGCPELAGLLHPMLYSMWNDAAEWATAVLMEAPQE